MRCRHCNRKIGKARARGLCCQCHREPDIRALYPVVGARGNRQRGVGCAQEDSIEDPPLPPEPTDTEPMSPSRIEVMRERDSAGYHVEHPQDNGAPARVLSDGDQRPPPMWRAILRSGVVIGGLFAPTKSEARAELKKRLRLSHLPSGTRLERVSVKAKDEGRGMKDETKEPAAHPEVTK